MPTGPGYRTAPTTDAGTRAPAAVYHADSVSKKFPTRAVAILALAMTINSYTMVSLFPYVGMMVKELLSLQSTNEIGFYAGYVASAFIFGRFLSGYIWGHFTDSVGRKPVIVAVLFLMAVFSVAFGFSTSYTWAVSWRLILGLTNGNVPALRSSISEICGPQHVVAGMTILASLRAPSMVFGTGIGGLLAQPAVRFPGVFSATGLLGRYPFLLPNLVGAWWALFVLALVVIYLPETKDDVTSREQDTETQRTSSDGAGDVTGTVTTGTTAFAEASPTSGLLGSGNASNSTKYQSVSTTSSGDDRGDWPNNGGGYEKAGVACGISPNDGDGGDNDDGLDETPALRRPGTIVNDNQRHGEEPSAVFGRNGLLANPLVKVFVVLACMVQALIMGFEEAYPLFALSTPDVGGLGWDTLQIGKVLVMTGMLMTAFQLALAPPVIKIIGIAAWQRLGFLVGVPAIAAVPAVKLLSWNNPSLFAVSVIANTLSLCSLSAVNLGLTIGSSTLGSSRTRGKLCGLVITAESFGRFVSPAVFATVYAWSISPSGSTSAHRLVDHNFAFYVLAAILAMCALLAWPTLTAEKTAKQDDVLVGGLQKRVPASKEERSCVCADLTKYCL